MELELDDEADKVPGEMGGVTGGVGGEEGGVAEGVGGEEELQEVW